MNKKRYLSGDMGEGDSKGLEQKKLKKKEPGMTEVMTLSIKINCGCRTEDVTGK